MMGNVDRPIQTAVIGLGRAGWDIHVRELSARRDFAIAAVFDPVPERRREAVAAGFCAYADLEELFRRESPELTVVASPSYLHENHSLMALAARSHVVCEKPLAGNVAAARRMIDAAAQYERLLIPVQPRRFTPTARALREVLASGKLGRIFSIAFSDLSYMRRNDWQCLLERGGGMLSNHGAHALDLVFHLLGEFPAEFHCFLTRRAAAGDAEDHVQFSGRTSHDVLIDVTLSNAAACVPRMEWRILGELGGCRLAGEKLSLRWFKPEELPALVLDASSAAAGRIYGNTEVIPWHEEEVPLAAFPVEHDFYDGVFAAVRQQAPPPVDCRETFRLIELLETCRKRNPVFSGEAVK